MALLAPQQSVIGGKTLAFTAAAVGGDTLAPNDHGVLLVNNASVAPITVTIVDPRTSEFGGAFGDPSGAVPAGGMRAYGPLPATLADPTTGLISITYSGVTTLTVAYVGA